MGEARNAFNILENINGRSETERLRRRWEDNIKTDVKKMAARVSTGPQRVPVTGLWNTVINFLVP
jgi:hypothetical protein